MKKQKGFTLVEIMIVVAIIGLLAAIAIPNFVKARARAREASEIQTMRTLASAYEQYVIEYNVEISTMGTRIIGPSGANNSQVAGPANYLKVPPRSVYDSTGNFTVGNLSGASNQVIYVKSPGSELSGTYTLGGGYTSP